MRLLEWEKIEHIFWGKIYRESKKTIQYVGQTDIDNIRYPELVMKLAEAQNGIITKQDVVELLKATPTQAYAIIKNHNKKEYLNCYVAENILNPK